MKLKLLFKKPFLWLSIFYLLTRLVNILKLPLFNDESIYIDWANKEINTKGLLYYSLYDGKPPLLMWIFGLFHKFIGDPLLAGRLVSVIAGFFTLLGIYKLSEKYFGERTARLSGLFYVAIPIFVFFDRQALMESALCAVGIWSIYYFLDLIGKPGIKNAIILGIIWGLGVFIKQSALIFIIAEILIFTGIHLKKRDRKFNVHFLLSLFISQAVLLPLYFQKEFWTSLSTASRFAMSFKEIFSFPISTWLQNLRGIFMIPFWYLGPLILAASVVGFFIAKNGQQRRLGIYYLISLFLVLIFSIIVSPRYLVSYLPLSLIFAAHTFTLSKFDNKFKRISLIVLIVFVPTVWSLVLIFNPINYFETLNKVTKYSQESEYVSGWTSGYATTNALSFIRQVSEKTPVVIGVRLDAGNPESAVFAYFNYSTKVLPIYFDSKIISQEMLKYDCLMSNYPFYFVARDNNLAGMDKFLVKVNEFKNPVGERSVGIYTLKSSCQNNVLKINF